MSDYTGENLRRLMGQEELTLEQVVQRTGLDKRTVKGVLHGTNKPHPRTIGRLAEGLGVPVDELYLDPSRLLYRRFDRDTNPVVQEVMENHPELFEGWTEGDFDELNSRFGTGGALTFEGTLSAAAEMNRKRELHEKLSVLLETSQADVVSGIVELLYDKVVMKGK